MGRPGWRWTAWLWMLLVVLLAADMYGRPAVIRHEEHGYENVDAVPETWEESNRQEKKPGRGEKDRPSETKEDTQAVKYIALTFDDGPHREYTPILLDGLKERGVHATFFLIGQNILGNEELVLRMKEEGHLIGNHSQNHVQLTAENEDAVCSQIVSTNQQIEAITGQTPEYVRPPFGSWDEELECLVPMNVVLWDIDPLDWKVQDAEKIVGHVVKRVEDGDIILLHDVYETSVEAALEIIDSLSGKGYNFVTVDELLIE